MDVGIGLSEDLPLAVQQRLAREVEAAGLRSLWTNEASGRDALLVCQAWAAATTTLEVGVGVAPIWTRTPAQLAMASATLQDASDGRFLLGLGVSHGATMGPWHGVEVRRPRTAAADLLTILTALERGERVDHDGEVFAASRFRLAIDPLPAPTRRYLAAMGPRMLALAGERADGVLLNWAGPHEVARAARRVRDAATATGRAATDVEVATYVRIAVHPDRDRARAALADQITRYAALPAYLAHLERQGLGAAAVRAVEVRQAGGRGAALVEALGDEAMEALGWAGTPDDATGELQTRFADAGLDHLVWRVVVVDDPVTSIEAVIRAVGSGGRADA